MKKWFSLLLFVVLLLSATVACAAYMPGTYTATATGMGGEFAVTATFDENGLTAIEIGEHKETPNLGTIPLEQLPPQIIENLYAAGEVANGTFFGNYYYICGNMVMHAMIIGQEAGINAAAHVK